MSLFGKIVRTAVNVATLPLDVAKDVVTIGGKMTGQDESYIEKKLDLIKEEAEDNE